VVALDDALQGLAKVDQRKCRIIELRYFGGLSIEEVAEVAGVSIATVRRDMRMAEAWLYREISRASTGDK
jgi:RNA polymerase sigma factor (sigma-70 family)